MLTAKLHDSLTTCKQRKLMQLPQQRTHLACGSALTTGGGDRQECTARFHVIKVAGWLSRWLACLLLHPSADAMRPVSSKSLERAHAELRGAGFVSDDAYLRNQQQERRYQTDLY